MDDEAVNFRTQTQSIQDMNQDVIQYENEMISGSPLKALFLHDTILPKMNHFEVRELIQWLMITPRPSAFLFVIYG